MQLKDSSVTKHTHTQSRLSSSLTPHLSTRRRLTVVNIQHDQPLCLHWATAWRGAPLPRRERARRGDVTVTSARLSALKSWRRWRRLLGAAEGRSEAFFLQLPPAPPRDRTGRGGPVGSGSPCETSPPFLPNFSELVPAGESARSLCSLPSAVF